MDSVDPRFKQYYYLNSHNRLNKGDPHANATYEINIHHEMTHIVCLKAIVPVSYYTIQPGSTFILDEGGTQVTVPITQGNYDINSLMEEMTAQLNNNSPNSWTYSMTFDDAVGKLTYTVSGNSGVQPKFIIDYKANNIGQVFGFNSNQTTYTFSSDKFTSPSIVYLIPESTIFIHSDIHRVIYDYHKSDVLQELYGGNALSFSNIVYQCTTPIHYSKPLRDPKKNIFYFKLTDENGNIVDLNDINWQATFLIYKKRDVYQMLVDFMRFYAEEKMSKHAAAIEHDAAAAE